MDDTFNKNAKYIDILSRIEKKVSTYEGLLIMKRQYYTNNSFYFFLCLIFRFIHIISFCGDYDKIKIRKRNISSCKQYLNRLTLYYLFKQLNISHNIYFIINLLILVLFLIRLLYLLEIIKKFNMSKRRENWIFPNKYQITIDHIVFLLFPYIIEYFSFAYYMCFFPNKFVINSNNINKVILYIFVFINTILIIIYNIDNYFGIVCANRIYKTTIYEANSSIKYSDYKINKSISFIYSNKVITIFIILQNCVIFLNLDNLINKNYKYIFKIIISIFLFLNIIIIMLCKINKFNYNNIINTSFIVIILFCFYTIIIDLILFLFKYRLTNELNEIIYLFIKIILSYITYISFEIKNKNYLENSITTILFQEKKNIKTNYFINSFYYLNQIMLEIKQQKKVESALSLVRFLSKHINSCKKLGCNCKLFESFIENKDIEKKKDEEESNKYLTELLTILNYLFESVFLDYEIYKNLDLIILLSEHFCHIRNNPTFSFSLIRTFILKNGNKLNKFQLITLYELNQKYIYFISADAENDIELNVYKDSEKLLRHKKMGELKYYYIIIKVAYNTKFLLNDYINNELNILKYKYIFDDSLSFKFDENNENIISVKINFYDQKAKIENEFDNSKSKRNKRIRNESTNLYNVINLLNYEQLYYEQIINAINEIDETKIVPIFITFKFFLFFDLFKGGQMPDKIGSKLYFCLNQKANLYNGNINNNDYYILKRKYNEENNKKDSKVYSIYEFKKGIRVKFLSENASLKMGFTQEEVVNQKIDVLLPNCFFKSHTNAIKQLIIVEQKKYNTSKKAYFFDKTKTILFTARFEASLIYDLTKYLIIMIESTLLYENEFGFMLDSNYDLVGTTKNFEEEYYLNQKILATFNIGFLDLLTIKKDNLNKVFEKEFIKIHFYKYMRKVKTEEYFIPNIYSTSEEKNNEINSNYFNSSKSNIISKISNAIIKEEKNNEFIDKTPDDDEEEKFIKRDNIKKTLLELFINPREVIFHKLHTIKVNKAKFIESIAKELTKIPDNVLMFENDKSSYNLIISCKKLINYLLTRNELVNEWIKINIKLTFFYDKVFYFCTIDDEKKSYLKFPKNIHFINNKKKYSTPIEYNKNKNSRNKSLSNSKIPLNKNSLVNKDKINDKNKKEYNIQNNYTLDKNKLENINEKRKKINKDKFITIIKWILSIIIFCILVIYFSIILFQKYILKVSKNVLLAYYYNSYTKDTMLTIHSKLLMVYYEYLGLINNEINSLEQYEDSLKLLGYLLKENYFNFYDYYILYNTMINHDYNLLRNNKNITKLRGYWQEKEYNTSFMGEIELIIFRMLILSITKANSTEINSDINNFLFFRSREKTQEKIYTNFIKMLYYFSSNYEFVFKEMFQDIENEVFNSYKSYIGILMKVYIFLEILGFLLFIIFLNTNNYYLYNSNEIIIKNIIFLFLEFNEGKNKDKKNNSINIINLKLLEYKKIMNDFNLERFEIYSKNLDNINRNKAIYLSDNLNNINLEDKNITNEKKNKKISNNETINQKGSSKNISGYNNDNQNSPSSKRAQDNNSNSYINKTIDSKSRRTNNSSHNILLESNSQFFKDKLNNNSIDGSKDFSIKELSSNYSKQNIKDKNSIIEENDEDKDLIDDILLNKSNKPTILLIKIYTFIMIIMILIITIFSIYKIIYTINFNLKFEKFFTDFSIITNRYSILYNYFNVFRTLLIYPESEKKDQLNNTMENLNYYFEQQNKLFINVLSSNMDTYKEIIKLFDILTESKNNSTEIIKDNICMNNETCLKYLESPFSIFGSGVDFAYKMCMTNIHNLFLDYKKLVNYTNINEINSTIINTQSSKFTLIGLSLTNMFFFVQEKIYYCFSVDVTNLNKSYDNNISLLNALSIFFSIFNFLFVIIFIFLTISNYARPIKESSYRINCSFNFIKSYSLTNFRNNPTTCT